ncbi:hypothetical protein FOL47_004767 [Perkinsus chesapeaki]|uniref:Uncharacterized protein n=1 Tax=Perkinsus chesapeaki TaxID=330153 RepID=A0A7J6MZ00_PERCH|nr:hypothetical protein FOL47_004767 [Perkinsus chesapeaki]
MAIAEKTNILSGRIVARATTNRVGEEYHRRYGGTIRSEFKPGTSQGTAVKLIVSKRFTWLTAWLMGFRAFHPSALGWDGKPSGLTADELVAVALLETGLHGLRAQRERRLPSSLFDKVAHEVKYFGWSTQAEIDRVRRPNQLPAYFHHSIRTGDIDPDRLLEDLARFYGAPSAIRLGRQPDEVMSITEVTEGDSN